MANNREGEGFIQERLDRFFGLAEWMVEKDIVKVSHILRQASNYSLLILDTQPLRRNTKSRFIFESQWIKNQTCDKLVQEAWSTVGRASRMFQVKQKLKCYKLSLLKWKREQRKNDRLKIELIQKEIECMQRGND